MQFTVKLSVEGFPQAVQVRRMQKHLATVTRSVGAEPGLARCTEPAMEVLLRQEACGQMRLLVGDQISFCVPEAWWI